MNNSLCYGMVIAMAVHFTTAAQGQLTYTTNNNEVTITGYSGSGHLNIPTTIDGMPVTSIKFAAFTHNTNLTSVILPNGVTNIGDGAFYLCTSLTNVTLGGGVIRIGGLAFSCCHGLTSVTLPDSVTNLCTEAFDQCSSLNTVTIGSGVAIIGGKAFASCGALSTVLFRGDAPSNFGSNIFTGSSPTIYCRYESIGWGATLESRPIAIWPELLTAEFSPSGFIFDVVASSNKDVVVEMCMELLDGNWTAVSTNSMIGEPVEITIPEWTNSPIRYFRVVLE